MLLNFKRLIAGHGLKIKGIIQAGAHYGEEIFEFANTDANNIVLFEPCKEAFETCELITKNCKGVTVINCALGSANGQGIMNVEKPNKGQSNSLLTPKLHKDYYPDIEFTSVEVVHIFKLNTFNISGCNLLVMDVQGYELEVLKGATETIKQVNYVYTEVNREELYKDCAMVEELDNYLADFSRVETKWTNQGWGDALYIRKTLL